jgi:hypothetical protein
VFTRTFRPAAVGHADHDLAHAVVAGAAARVRRSSGIRESPPSSEKRFWPTYFVWQVPLQALGSGQALEQVAALLGRQLVAAGGALEALVQPAPLLALPDVHELGADGARVRRPGAGRRCP